jgi:hypothetical protein
VGAIRSGDAETARAAFRKARKTIFQQIERERLHYPYRVARLFLEFYDSFVPYLSQQDKDEIGRAARYISDRIERLPGERQDQRHVEECWQTMQRIIDATGARGAEGAPAR